MIKVRVTETELVFRCPAGCREHRVPRNRWTLTGSAENPTITPSVRETVNPKDHPHYQPRAATSVCHCVVTDGMIHFCDDCTHELAGQHMPLEEIT